MKLTCENSISKGGSAFEILTKIWSGYIPIRNLNTPFKKLIDRNISQIQIKTDKR